MKSADANDRFLTPAAIEACQLLNDGFLPRDYAASRHQKSGPKAAHDAGDCDDRILSHDANATMHFYSAATEPNNDNRFLPHDADIALCRMNDETLDENITTERHRVDRGLPTGSTLNAVSYTHLTLPTNREV